MKVICISGKAGHGKDTVAGMMAEMLESDGYSTLVTHFADLVKYVCKMFFGWNGEKDEYGRSLLQRVGTDIVRAKDPDYWVGFVAEMMSMFDGEWDYVLVPDCRFPNEVDYLKASGFNTEHIRVFRKDYVGLLTNEQKSHPSEIALDGVKPDRYIENDGSLEDLRRKIADVLVDLNGFHQVTMEEVTLNA